MIVDMAGITVFFNRDIDGGGRTFGKESVDIAMKYKSNYGRAFEWCSGPAFMAFYLLGSGACDSLCLADVNPEAVEYIKKTIKFNGLEDKVSVYLSDNIKDIPEDEKWDVVIGNPPHYKSNNRFSDSQRLRAVDQDWKLHISFFKQVVSHLNDGARLFLVENKCASTPEEIMSLTNLFNLEDCVYHNRRFFTMRMSKCIV